MRLIHSVESESVVEQIERHAERPARVLLEVNVAGEETKYGVPPRRSTRSSSGPSAAENVVFAGLMTMPPFAERPGGGAARTSRACASSRERLRARLGAAARVHALSMGTSQDFEVAVEEGATIVRLGSVLLCW